MFAGGETYCMPLHARGRLAAGPRRDPRRRRATRAKLLWLNYPNNPTGAVADLDFFERGRAPSPSSYDVADPATTTPTATSPTTATSPPRASCRCRARGTSAIEFHSLSKTYNMTGWRIGMAVGNAEMIDALMRVKSNVD